MGSQWWSLTSIISVQSPAPLAGGAQIQIGSIKALVRMNVSVPIDEISNP